MMTARMWTMTAISSSLIAALVGCSRQTEVTRQEAVEQAPADASEQMTVNKVIEETREAARAFGEFAADTKDEFVREGKEHLARLDERIVELKKRSSELSADARAKWNEQLADLEARRKEFASELEEVQNASGDAWKDVSDGAKSAWAELTTGVEKAAHSFSHSDAEPLEVEESETQN